VKSVASNTHLGFLQIQQPNRTQQRTTEDNKGKQMSEHPPFLNSRGAFLNRNSIKATTKLQYNQISMIRNIHTPQRPTPGAYSDKANQHHFPGLWTPPRQHSTFRNYKRSESNNLQGTGPGMTRTRVADELSPMASWSQKVKQQSQLLGQSAALSQTFFPVCPKAPLSTQKSSRTSYPVPVEIAVCDSPCCQLLPRNSSLPLVLHRRGLLRRVESLVSSPPIHLEVVQAGRMLEDLLVVIVLRARTHISRRLNPLRGTFLVATFPSSFPLYYLLLFFPLPLQVIRPCNFRWNVAFSLEIRAEEYCNV